MRRLSKIAVFAVLGCSFALAQTTTTITGTIRDLAQALVTSGKVTFALTPSRDTTISGYARFSPQTITCTITGAGLIKALDGIAVCTVTKTTSLQPTGEYYVVCYWPGNVKTACFTFYAVNDSYDWSTVVPTPATSPAQNFVDVFSNQSIGGTKTWLGPQIFSNSATFGAIFGTTATFATPGVFSSSLQSDYVQVLLNGIDPKTEYQSGGFLQNQTEALVGGVAVPVGSTIIQANGVAGYANSSAPATNAVGGYFHCRSLITNAPCWGFNPLAVSTPGQPTTLISGEVDLNITNLGDLGCGLCVTGFWLVQPTVAPNANVVGKPLGGPSFFWNDSLLSSAGCCTNSLISGPSTTAATNVPSQPILFQSVDSGGVVRGSTMFADALGNYQVFPFGGVTQLNGNASITKKITGYNNIPTAGAGVAYEAAAVNLNGQTAAIGTTTLYAIPVDTTNSLTGTVNTAGTAVTWVSGPVFLTTGVMPGSPITINAVTYTVASVTNSVSLTLTSTAGTQTAVAFTWLAPVHARINWNAGIVIPATTSSTLGALTIVYTDLWGVAHTITAPATIPAGTIATTSTVNTTATLLAGLPLFVSAKPGTSITYAFAYASVGATAMQYALNIANELL